jgi:hypothetical protein
MASPRSRLALALAGAALAALAVVACAQKMESDAAAPGTCACAGAEAVVDPALLAFLSKARAAHHEADLAEDAKDLKGAVAALTRVTSGPHPSGAPEVAEVLADTRARLADLESQLGQSAQALGEVEAGLTLADQPTHFRGHLFEVKGVVLERQAGALKAQGDTAGAERVKGDAIKAFDEAIEIQNKVIEKALSDKAKGGRAPVEAPKR